MKRKFHESQIPDCLNEGDFVTLAASNFHEYQWGFQQGDSCISIVRKKKLQQIFSVSKYGSYSNTISLTLAGSNPVMYASVDQDCFDLVLSEGKFPFVPEITDRVGNALFVRLATKEGWYIRHSNYKIRADMLTDSDKPMAEDSLWIVQTVDFSDESASTVKSTPHSTDYLTPLLDRPLFAHIPDCFPDSEQSRAACDPLNDYIEELLILSKENPRSERVPGHRDHRYTGKVVSYPLQGAGGMGMDAKATAISTFRPDGHLTEDLKHRIEQATTVKSRGGTKSFIKLPEPVAKIIQKLERVALSNMRRMKMFGMIKRRSFELELGFCEWVTLPNGSEIVPHRDGGNDCDVAAIFAIRNEADVTVEGTTVRLGEGQMYLFEPQKYTHSVSVPFKEGPRHVVALRFFRTYN
jgi:hypothetical protein